MTDIDVELYDDVERVPVEDLVPYVNNPKDHPENQIEKLVSSIKNFGFTVPLIVDGDGEVIAGHARLKAAERLGLEEVPVIQRGDLSEAEVRALRIADNRVAESKWDNELLAVELEQLQDHDLGTEVTGFEKEEVEDIMQVKDEVEEDDFEADKEEVETGIERGDVFKLGDHYLMCGDSTKDIETLLDVDPSIDSFDVLLTDPPYGISVVGDSPRLSGGSLGFNPDDKGKPKNYRPVEGDDTDYDPSFLLSYGDIQLIFGAQCFASKLPENPRWLVWDKKPESNTGNFFGDAELIWTNDTDRKSVKIYRHIWNGMVREGDRKAEGERVHPTQKPVGLLGEFLKDYSEEKDTVLDPYGGSGSTLIACEQLNRRCFMRELNPVYCQVIIDRWEEYTGNTAEEL